MPAGTRGPDGGWTLYETNLCGTHTAGWVKLGLVARGDLVVIASKSASAETRVG